MMLQMSRPLTVISSLLWIIILLILFGHSLCLIPCLADIRNWIRNIEQHASDNVNKILVGNKADMDESKRVCPVNLILEYYLVC